ncbi:e88e5cd0-37d8-4b52-ab01-53f6ae8184e4 [Thermothielavioides terrestris]|jgi:hypothetical protein|uniref:F-box domain-containing protein n=2 Tax=Thermothielavioides terrestris TaxID=2587410 RepID=G2RCW7_THETT|nr:uncharacterized protein THITE_2131416 [Thermothielavioides terrestris NRRL 8126]AEO69855.1 hypothetical protein THITE_2131416 [Thermothielavioides terrestris NRRL 8126]SPQ17650.1 e88e5cd0-37d8-4b52-ab01-53f6ae8184e4 [Thermothielavioides terrestris]
MDAPAKINFFHLPREIRDKIYREVLVSPNPIHLVRGLFAEPWKVVAAFPPTRGLALLYVNRQLYDEGRIVLYRSNTFTLVGPNAVLLGDLQEFLACIGSVNSNLLKHICMPFPRVTTADGGAKLNDNDVRCLELLGSSCGGLKTLELTIYSQEVHGPSFASHDSTNAVLIRSALAQLVEHLKVIPSLHSVHISSLRRIAPPIVEVMKGYGWEVSVSEMGVTSNQAL